VYNKYSPLPQFTKKPINNCNDIVLMCCTRVFLIVLLNIYNHYGYLDDRGYNEWGYILYYTFNVVSYFFYSV